MIMQISLIYYNKSQLKVKFFSNNRFLKLYIFEIPRLQDSIADISQSL